MAIFLYKSTIFYRKLGTRKFIPIFGTQHLTNLWLGFVIWKSEIGDVGWWTIDGNGDSNSDGDVETNCWWDQMAEGQVNGLGGTDSVFPD